MKKLLQRIFASALSITFLFSENYLLARCLEDFVGKMENSTAEKSEIVCEIPEKRSEFTKHFRMNDGSITAITYADQVHYKDGSNFKEIDNSLIDDENGNYQNTDSPFKIKFSKDFKNKDLVSISSDGHDLSWSYIKKKYKQFDIKTSTISQENVSIDVTKNTENSDNIEDSHAQANTDSEESAIIDNNAEFNEDFKQDVEKIPSLKPITITTVTTKAVTEEDIAKIPVLETKSQPASISNFKDKTSQNISLSEEKLGIKQVYSMAKYQDCDKDIDLDYKISGMDLKESIILREKLSDNDRFDFEFKATDLTISKDDTGNLNFTDNDGKIVFVMPKGCMWDSNDNFSSDVEYEVTKLSDRYIITVIPNRAWLESNERAYPITIDPSIKTKLEDSSYDCAYIGGGTYKDSNFYNHNNIPVGSLNFQHFTLFKYTKLPVFSHGEIITSAKISLNLPTSCNNGSSYEGDLVNQIAIKEITSDWNPHTVTYNTKPSTSTIITDCLTVDSTNKYYSWDVTSLAKKWYQMAEPNNNLGFQIEPFDYNHYSLYRFVSKNSADGSHDVPRFEINYKEFIGEEDYWSYTSHTSGYKGVGKVNNYAGTLSVSDEILSYSGSRNPVSVYNTYNNVNYNEQANSYVHTQTFSGGYSHSSASGLGFRLSFNQIVYPTLNSTSEIEPEEDWRYVYVDGDGTQHYFKFDQSDGKIKDVDGLNLTLAESNGVITIQDIKDNKLTFKKVNKLDEAYSLLTSVDNNGNTTKFN